jgi:hypothetical protein
MGHDQVIARVRDGIRAAVSSDDVLIVAVQTSCTECQIPYGEVWARYASNPSLFLAAAWHQPDMDMAAFIEASRKFAFAPGVGLPGRVWQSRKLELISDIQDRWDFTRRALAVAAGFQNALALPIVDGDEVVAVLAFFDVRRRHPPGLFERIAKTVSAELARRRAGPGPTSAARRAAAKRAKLRRP